MTEFISFFVIIAAGVIFTSVFYRLHLPWLAALLFSGIMTGPHGLGLFTNSGALEFIGAIGLVFLMFMAGLEVDLSHLDELYGDSLKR